MKSKFNIPFVKPILWLSLVLTVSFACHRDKKDVLGPGYIMAPEGFSVTAFTVTPDSVDFGVTLTDAPIVFNSTFTHSVSWILTIKGKQSGAVHSIRGISNGLNNVAWTGIHDGLAFFKKGEIATATLSFYGTEFTSAVDVFLITTPNYRACGMMSRYSDMEDSIRVTNVYNRIDQPGVTLGSVTNAVDLNGNPIPPIQGDRYFMIKGKNTQNNIFVAGLKYKSSFIAGANSLPLTADPNDVWINVYAYSTGDDHLTFNIELQEDDDLPVGNDYQPAGDDAYVASYKQIKGSSGWSLISVKYSNVPRSTSAENGGSGNNIQEPLKLKYVVFTLLKDAAYDAEAEVYFDYPIITIGGPFKPCK